MAALSDLVCAGLIEKDTNGDTLWTWSYPSVTEEQRDMFLQKSKITSHEDTPINFIYSQWRKQWYYIFTSAVNENDKLPKVKMFSLVLVAKDFNPEKYDTLCRLFSKQFRMTGSPASILEGYLAVATRGSYTAEENGKFSVKDFDEKQAYAGSNLRGIINVFGVETIILYTAMMLKKRVVFYAPPRSLHELLFLTSTLFDRPVDVWRSISDHAVKQRPTVLSQERYNLHGMQFQIAPSLPALVWHRQNWNIVFPFIELNDNEIDDLKNNKAYVAGFTDASVEGRSDLYDVFANIATGQIFIASQAKAALAMGKLHKDIAMFMVECVGEEQNSEQQIIKAIAEKTKELLNNLKSLATEQDGKVLISLESLKERKMQPVTENFLFSLAACEGLVRL